MGKLHKRKIVFIALSITLVLCFCFKTAIALSVKDIPYNQVSSKKIINIVDAVHQHAEPYCQYWNRNWESPSLKNTVKTTLYYALSQIDTLLKETENSFTFSFLSGIIWHHLYQVEVDSAFAKADSIADWIQITFPKRQANARWLKGVNLVKAAQIRQGFNLLENLHTVEVENNESFLRDYAALSALCFLPRECVNNESLQLVLLPQKQSLPINLKLDEMTPQKESWQTVSDLSNKQRSIPTFIFSADFSFSKPVTLTFPPLRQISDFKLDMKIDKEEVQQLSSNLFYNPSAQKFDTEIKVIVDNSKSNMSVGDYAYDIVWNNYDMVKTVDEFSNLKGISLRCYKKSIFKNVPGEFYAYAVFDKRTYGNCQRFYQPLKKNLPDEPFHIRYIIAMKTSEAVEEKAEVIFQNVVSRFDHLKQ